MIWLFIIKARCNKVNPGTIIIVLCERSRDQQQRERGKRDPGINSSRERDQASTNHSLVPILTSEVCPPRPTRAVRGLEADYSVLPGSQRWSCHCCWRLIFVAARCSRMRARCSSIVIVGHYSSSSSSSSRGIEKEKKVFCVSVCVSERERGKVCVKNPILSCLPSASRTSIRLLKNALQKRDERVYPEKGVLQFPEKRVSTTRRGCRRRGKE